MQHPVYEAYYRGNDQPELKPKTNLNLKVMKNFETNNRMKMQWPEKLTAHVKPKTQQKNEKPPNP